MEVVVEVVEPVMEVVVGPEGPVESVVPAEMGELVGLEELALLVLV